MCGLAACGAGGWFLGFGEESWKMLKVLSLGAGVQSTTLLLMSCLGELPLLDAAVFADTQWEPAEVYAHLGWLATYAGKAGIKVHQVTAGNLRGDALISQVRGKKSEGVRWASMPMYVKGPAGELGMIRRQCTSEYKIAPLEKFTRQTILGIKPRHRAPKNAVETWVGISADEAGRMSSRRPSYWQQFRYPLIFDVKSPTGLLSDGFTRQDCLDWLKRQGFPEPPRSACIGCPYHSDAEWRRIKDDPIAWADACEFDDRIRDCGGMRGKMFLHRLRIPLRDVPLDPVRRWDGVRDNECLGMCGA